MTDDILWLRNEGVDDPDATDYTDKVQAALDKRASEYQWPGFDVRCGGSLMWYPQQKHVGRGMAPDTHKISGGTRLTFTGEGFSGIETPPGEPFTYLTMRDMSVKVDKKSAVQWAFNLNGARQITLDTVAVYHANPGPDKGAFFGRKVPGHDSWVARLSNMVVKVGAGQKKIGEAACFDWDITAIKFSNIYFNGGTSIFRGKCGHTFGPFHADSTRHPNGEGAAFHFIGEEEYDSLGFEMAPGSFLQNDVGIRIDLSKCRGGKGKADVVLEGHGFMRNALDIDLIGCYGAKIGLNSWSEPRTLKLTGAPLRLTNAELAM